MDVREFERRFKAMYLPLGMYALRVTGDVGSAEDAVQEAFVKVWAALQAGTRIDSFRAYMYRAVRNECVAVLRGKHDFVDIYDAADVSEPDIDTSERDARVWQAIDGLPDRCREIFLMSKRDGLSNEEIAEELGVSVKTVKNHMTKAFARLRDALAPGHKPFFLPFL